ncbi:TolC family protein [Gemmatimonas groenlandica]|uniref:TolC family protein n=1 Tax=Gemmatimonas groenlandica TaxID=2732249 RepID=A0A6M4IPA8_9BACT|nr:TolC family protein [Gemmatimonas groenlandica]QJR35357.1 TolC family protein [Gemmatimonas groenlandica]
MKRAWPAFSFTVATLLSADTTLPAQSSRDTVRIPTMSQSLDMLIARLPGRPVSLSELIGVGLQEGFAAQLAAATRRRADGSVMYESRALDPQVRLQSDVAGASRTGTITTVSGRETTVGIDGSLPWGTLLSADYGRTGTAAALGAGGGGAEARTPARLSLAFSQPVLDGFNQRTLPWRAAQLERVAAGQQYSRVREEIATDLEVRYWQLAEAQAIEVVYGRSLEIAREILARNTELASRDLVARVDVLTVRSGVALRESFFTQARQARYERSDALLFAAYGAKAADIAQADTLPVVAEDNAEMSGTRFESVDDLAEAMVNRTDLRAARSIRDASRVRASQARNTLLPSLSLAGGYTSQRGNGYSGGGTPVVVGTSNSSWRLGVSVAAPLLNRGDRGLSLLAKTQLDIEDIRVRAQEALVTREVRRAARSMALGMRRWQSASAAADLAWEQLVAERRRLELGLGDSFRLLQTEENAVQAQLEAVRARYEVLRARAEYRLAIGDAIIAGR